MITVKVRVEYIHSFEDFEEVSATLKKKKRFVLRQRKDMVLLKKIIISFNQMGNLFPF